MARAGCALSLFAVACAAQLGCHNYETRASVRDPSQVSVLARRNDGGYDMVLAGGREPATAVFWGPPGGGLVVRAVRTPSSIELRCEACQAGNIVLLDDKKTSLEVEEEASDVLPPGSANLRLRYHYTVSSASGGGGGYTWYNEQYLQPALETPAANVDQLSQRKTPDRLVGVGFLVPGVLFTALGYFLAKNDVGVGTPILIGGLGFDALAVYHLAWPAKETVQRGSGHGQYRHWIGRGGDGWNDCRGHSGFRRRRPKRGRKIAVRARLGQLRGRRRAHAHRLGARGTLGTGAHGHAGGPALSTAPGPTVAQAVRASPRDRFELSRGGRLVRLWRPSMFERGVLR